jgi:hypothetical protein
LPSLIPRESSTYFSSTCIELLTNSDDQTKTYWNNTKKMFHNKIMNMDEFQC